jgi:hypothetical protein
MSMEKTNFIKNGKRKGTATSNQRWGQVGDDNRPGNLSIPREASPNGGIAIEKYQQ